MASERKWAIVDKTLHEGTWEEMEKIFDSTNNKNIKLVEILEEK
jgi:hypothetical protein